jgi:hypothetical protein
VLGGLAAQVLEARRLGRDHLLLAGDLGFGDGEVFFGELDARVHGGGTTANLARATDARRGAGL